MQESGASNAALDTEGQIIEKPIPKDDDEGKVADVSSEDGFEKIEIME